MKGKAYLLSIALILSLIQACVLTGCSEKSPDVVSSPPEKEGSSNVQLMSGQGSGNQRFDLGEQAVNQVSDSAGTLEFVLTLDNGTKISRFTKTIQGDTLSLRFRYQDAQGVSEERILKLTSMSGASLCKTDGRMLFNYDFELGDPNQVNFVASTPLDSLRIIYEKFTDSLKATFFHGGTSHTIRFNNADEAARAGELFAAYHGVYPRPDLSDHDFSLLQELEGLAQFLDVPNDFTANSDVSTTSGLMSNPAFIIWLDDNSGELQWHCGRKCICAVAGILAAGSGPALPLIWPVVIFIPATGVSAACLLADLIEGD